jgi:ribosomal protein S1
MDFGAIVDLVPGQDGLLHVSELAPWRVEKVEDIVKIGDIIPVKVKRMENGKISLTLKEVAPPDFYKSKRGAAPPPFSRPQKFRPQDNDLDL